MKRQAQIFVLTALRDSARALVAAAQSPLVVDAASDEWKRLDARIDKLDKLEEPEVESAVPEDDAEVPAVVNFSRPLPKE